MKNEIILLTINSKSRLYSITEKDYSAIQPNIPMALLGAYLRDKGIEVKMIDETYDFSIDDYVNYVLKENPVLAGVICCGANPSSSTMSMVGAIKFFEEFNKHKFEGTTFIMGGHPSVMSQRTLDETKADYVIIGEGYETIPNLYNYLVNNYSLKLEGLAYYNKYNSFVNTGFPKLIDVNTLPMIDWKELNPWKYKAHNWHCFDDINHRKPYGVIWTTFGCPYGCTFCCINNIFGQRSYRLRSIDSVVAEIDVLVKEHNVRNIKILDELFIINNPRIYKFCSELERRKYDLNIWAYARMDTVDSTLLRRLKGVGVNWIAYGFETASEEVLSTVKKGYTKNDFYNRVIKMTQDAGIYICADFMAGLWNDSHETLEQTYEFACKHNFEWLNLYPAFAYPGTPMYNEYIQKGRIKEPEDWEEYALYGYNCKPLPTKHLTSAQVLEFRDKKFIEYHSRPKYKAMIEEKFGKETAEHIKTMTKSYLPRRLTYNSLFNGGKNNDKQT